MNRGRCVVFIGPTLTTAEARCVLDAEFLPPVQLGDVWRMSQEQPEAIGIVDGYFHQVPAVWHKEILYALSRGIAVYGAASMGALRAAELGAFGMVGVGTIAADYASGVIDADDEVTLLHAPVELEYQGLSEPLVNIRATLDAARREGVMSTATAEHLLSLARSLTYPNRVWQRILEAASGEEARALVAWLPAGRVNQKRNDALSMLERMRGDLAADSHPSIQASPVFFPTVLWQQFVLRETPFSEILDEFLLMDPLPPEFGNILAPDRRTGGIDDCAILSKAPQWPICCRRARIKRNAIAGRAIECYATDSDRLLSWFFAERLGWPSDLGAFLLSRGWTDPQSVLRVAAREAMFLSARTGDALDAKAPDFVGLVRPG
ncbi:hypothetical protein LMG28614_05608 [Paraburkholderia ultramafica]|uniref:TfuA-like core domain-containing protein n=1 Tax=Paraburkholderia ultramafica TaxID=1544867 RepID=A0A6S7BXV4_9BURK|nr:TfuA-like protein [Paraburkholderia ultramafica]CAB3802437.1 hypothetical protein LMG28614_05608 [Paraburkholderia ultramafica]